MPTYEYECTKCGDTIDYFQSIKEAPKEICEKCGGPLIKLLSAGTGLIFKGSGFYITDYKTKSGGEGSSKDSSSKNSGSGKTESAKSVAGTSSDSGKSAPPANTGGESKSTATPSKTTTSGSKGGD